MLDGSRKLKIKINDGTKSETKYTNQNKQLKGQNMNLLSRLAEPQT